MAKKFFKSIYFSVRRIYSEVLSHLIDTFRDKISLFFIILYPIIVLVIFGLVFGGAGEEVYNLNYINEDLDTSSTPYPESQMLLSSIQNSSNSINLIDANYNFSLTTPSEWLIENEKRTLLVIPQGWSENLTNPNPLVIARVKFYYDPTYTSAITMMEIIDNVVMELNNNVTGNKTLLDTEIITTPEREKISYIDYYVPGVIGITISTSGMIGLVNFVNSEKRNGIIYKKSSSQMRKWEWALAKEIWQLLLGLVAAVITIITAIIVFHFKITLLHPLMILIVIFGTMTFAGIGLIFARIIKNPDAASALTMIYVFPQIFLAGATFPIEFMPDFLKILAKFFPLYYMSEGLRNVMLPSTEHLVWMNLGILAAMGIISFVIGVLITEWKKN